MVDVKSFELLCHVDSCIVVGHQAFMSDFVLPRIFLMMSFESLYASRCLTPISSTSCIPVNRALYSVTLLEHGSANENA